MQSIFIFLLEFFGSGRIFGMVGRSFGWAWVGVGGFYGEGKDRLDFVLFGISGGFK